jgi:hypothetical protein
VKTSHIMFHHVWTCLITWRYACLIVFDFFQRACQFLWHYPKRKTIPNLTLWAYIKLNTNANNGGFGHPLEYQYTLVWAGHWNPGANSANYFGWGIIRCVSGNQTEKKYFPPTFFNQYLFSGLACISTQQFWYLSWIFLISSFHFEYVFIFFWQIISSFLSFGHIKIWKISCFNQFGILQTLVKLAVTL